MKFLVPIGIIMMLFACQKAKAPKKEPKAEVPMETIINMEIDENRLPLERLNLPEGFSISIFAEVQNARSLARGAKGTIFVGNRREDKVYAVVDKNKDGKADGRYEVASGLNMPCGVAFHKGDLYVAEVNRLLRYKDIEDNLDNIPQPEVVYDDFPTEGHHGWKFIRFGPDGKLYVPVGAPCNICKSDEEIYASITRMNPDGTGREIYAHGVRNTVGFDWHPLTKEMWFTDNGRDNMGDDVPPCELNHITRAGQHFGYPYCHGGTIADPKYGSQRPCSDFRAPAQNLGAHVAPLGIRFYTGDMFPKSYKNQALFAEHGSWNRSKKVGYKIAIARIEQGSNVTAYETFIDGWLDDDSQEAWGRPVDVLNMPDGSMLISDDYADVIYRVVYSE
ncbi:MAG: sorbosone dehydrogenase family protein [Bacteroidia bacterium]